MSSKKILLVDDMRVDLEVEKTFLKRAGCQIITASGGMEALEKVFSEIPDLVFLDLIMPDMDGDKVCTSIKKDEISRNIPVVIVSGSRKKEDIERCRKAGCDDYLTKPIKQQELLDEAARILKIPQRKDLRVSVRIKVEGEAGAEYFYGESENISLGGILIKSEVPLKIGAEIKLKFLLPGEQYHVEAKGEVVRTDEESFKPEYGLGIIFQEVGQMAKEMIEDFIRQGDKPV
jgi:two-component system cell cycle response regulator